jgi:hypothetical protein
MGKTRLRLALACIAIVAAAIGAAGGSAGNRTAEVTFEFLPGTSFTLGETFATETSIRNTGSSNFTHVELHQQIPTNATLLDSSCAEVTQGNEVICNFDSLGSGNTITVTFLWQAPTSGAACTGCVTTDLFWIIKEGKPTNSNEVFPLPGGPSSASLLGNDPTTERKRAGGYETAGVATCNAGSGNLHTNPALTKDDPVSSTLCLPAGFTIPPGSSALGYSSTINEVAAKPANGSHKELGQSIVCVAALGQSCAAGHTPVNWGTDRARHVFQILEDALKGPKEITQVFHNGVQLPSCSVSPNFAQGCVQQIIPPPDGASPEIWTVIADAPTNGPWNW